VPPAVRRDIVPGPAPAPTAPAPEQDSASGGGGDSSQTNVQEAGVDEPDTVKTDGNVIWAIENGALHAVDARAATPTLLSTLPLDEGYGTTMLGPRSTSPIRPSRRSSAPRTSTATSSTRG
jgi:hypothetical protein